MNKLKKTIEEYQQWEDLTSYIDRIETYIEIDFSHSLESAKALLESIGKEICFQNGIELTKTSKIQGIMKQCFSSIGYTNSSMVQQISRSLATIGQQVGNLRNEIGSTSHGKTIEEIKRRNDNIDLLTRDFLIDTIETICVFIIRNYECKKDQKNSEKLEESLDYWDAEGFNEYWDELYGEFTMGNFSYTASEILFNVDKEAYINEYQNHLEFEEE